MVGSEITGCSQGPSFLPQEIAEDMFSYEILQEQLSTSVACNKASITVDNLMSPSHTIIKFACQDHKGLLYDIMRTLKDYNIQVHDSISLKCLLIKGLVIICTSKVKFLNNHIHCEHQHPL